MSTENPFEVTKAVDFTDEEIYSTWVDLPGGGFSKLASPTSPMSCFLVGGKGGGRTHLLRYYSYPLQRIRNSQDIIAGIQSEGYIGIYFRCTGLNSARFAGKNESAETWASVFAFYTDIWLAQIVVGVVAEVMGLDEESQSSAASRAFAKKVIACFDVVPPASEEWGAVDLLGYLRQLQRRLDMSINNAALERAVDVQVVATPGRLVSGVPRAASEAFLPLSNLRVAYLIDEFENLTLEQQKYINTLIREKELPTTFLIGSRLWGIRTHETFSAGEENRQGSEYYEVLLEEAYKTSGTYSNFCTEIVQTRLNRFGITNDEGTRLAQHFQGPMASTLEERARTHVSDERPWLEGLKVRLAAAGTSTSVRNRIVKNLRIPDQPLLEKFGLFLFYRGWALGHDLEKTSLESSASALSMIAGASKTSKVATSYKHYKEDLYAQLLNDLGKPQEYYGFDSFVRMSGYLPRNLLIVLKQVTRWSLFYDERAFMGGALSLRAQERGVREASEWFLSDSKGLGRLGADTQSAIRRLGNYLQAHRFSDKPVEPSCTAFETNRHGLTEGAVACLDEAVTHSLLLETRSGRPDKNTRVIHFKYQINPMLSPLFDLPVSLRGVARYSTEEMNAIFDPGTTEAQFARVRRRRLNALNAPFRDRSGGGSENPTQGELGI